jgi:hypothetical protein
MMKRLFFMVIVFALAGYNLAAGENLEFSWDIGNLCSGIYLDPNADAKFNTDMTISLVSFFLEYKMFVISWDAVRLYSFFPITMSRENLKIRHMLYFVNLDLFFKLWETQNKQKLAVGPFVGINYLCLRDWEYFEYDTAMLSSGVRLAIRTEEPKFPVWFSGTEIEAGVRNIGTDFVIYLNCTANIKYFKRKN